MIYGGVTYTVAPIIILEKFMRITLESEYALRIVTALAQRTEIVDAKTLSDDTCVTLRFTLKILHKLVLSGIVKSYKGVNGGYKLVKAPENITFKNIIELIDGPIVISRCLESGESCALNIDKASCIYHHIFDKISLDVARQLSDITIKDIIDKKCSR